MLKIITQRELGFQFNSFSDKLKTNLEKEQQILECKQNHQFGYAPCIQDGPCRFCFGKIRKSDKEIYQETIAEFITKI